MNLIYISNTRIPSEKANTYQSMVMCEAFSRYINNIEFWYPDGRTTKEMKQVSDPFDFYGIEKVFELKKVNCIDNDFLFTKFNKYWFLLKSISFSLNYIKKLRKVDDSTIIFTRDIVGLNLLIIAKRFGIIKQKIFFEAHVHSKNISKASKYLDGLIVINSYLKKLYEENSLVNIFVAHDGVRIETFKEIEEEKAKEILNFDKEIKYLTYIGRFNTMGHEKGIPEIIESFSYIKSENVKLLFVGGPLDNLNYYYKIAKKFNIAKEKIVFIDRQPVSDLYKYISASSILLMPFPWTEHYAYFMSPLKMFEYMVSKRPIIATRLPSIEEVLLDAKNAVLCEADDPKDLANKILWVLDNDSSSIVNQAYNDVQEYTWDNRAKKIVRWIFNEG